MDDFGAQEGAAHPTLSPGDAKNDFECV